MNDLQLHNRVQFPVTPETPAASAKDSMDKALADLQIQKDAWVACSIQERITMIDQLVKDFDAVAPRIVETEMKCKFDRAKLSHALARRLVNLEVAPSFWKFLGVLYTVVRG